MPRPDLHRLLTPGTVLALVSAILYLIAWNRGIALLYGMFALVLATLLISWILPRWAVTRVEAVRQHPARAIEGEEVEFAISLKNSGWIGRYMLEVWDHLPFATPDSQQAMGFIPMLGDRHRVSLNLPCDLRGEYTFDSLMLKTGFPFGLHVAERRLATTPSTLLVYPSVFKIARFDYLGNESLPAAGNRSVIRAGGAGDFMGVREYRRGDSPRHIHWSASAHHGALMVRELEWLSITRVTLVLNLNAAAICGDGKESTLEYAVKIAASIARHALDEGHSVALFGHGRDRLSIQGGRGEGHFQTLLEALARVRADGDTSYAETIRRAGEHDGGRGVLIVFENQPSDTEHGGFIDTGQHRLIRIRFDADSFRYPARRSVGGGRSVEFGDQVYHIGRGADLERVFAT
ncbi:MAG: DUF58 domain-containing protein [Pseudomonadota bacterium]